MAGESQASQAFGGKMRYEDAVVAFQRGADPPSGTSRFLTGPTNHFPLAEVGESYLPQEKRPLDSFRKSDTLAPFSTIIPRPEGLVQFLSIRNTWLS